MSLKAIEQALGSLLPSLAEDLPDTLVKLATSLLAQSRSNGGSLKAEAEIARPYACAEIACKRLAKTMKLPSIISRPPCPPKAYKNLYTFLEQVLSASSTGPKPQERNGALARPKRAAAQNNLQKVPQTPQKSKPVELATPTRSSKRVREQNMHKSTPTLTTKVRDAPAWTMPVIRKTCKLLAKPLSDLFSGTSPELSASFPPHIFAGVSSIISFVDEVLGSKKTEIEERDLLLGVASKSCDAAEYRRDVTAIIMVVYFLVVVRRLGIGNDSSRSESKHPPELNLEMLETLVKMALENEADLECDVILTNVHKWLCVVVTYGWTQGTEWFENIPTEQNATDKNASRVEDEDEDDGFGIMSSKKRKLINRYLTKANNRHALEQSSQKLLSGINTMMHDRVDWLSQERKVDYLDWKSRIMECISKSENELVGA